MKPFPLGPPWKYVLGSSKIGGSYVPAGYKIVINYTNMGTTQKTLYSIIERLE